MKLLIELFGEEIVSKTMINLKSEVPNMNEDYYIRNIIRSLNG